MVTADDVEQLIGAVVLDRENDLIGQVREVYPGTGLEAPDWICVSVPTQGTEVLVPLEGAVWDDDALRAAVARSTTSTAPDVEPLSTENEERLLTHYGIPCVRQPRGPVDLPEFGDDGICYSVQETAPVSDEPLYEQRGLADAVDGADRQRAERVCGHMFAAAPPPLGSERAAVR